MLRQSTRWSSTFNMVKRYFDLQDAINTLDDSTAALMPTRREENQPKSLLDELKAFESSSKNYRAQKGCRCWTLATSSMLSSLSTLVLKATWEPTMLSFINLSSRTPAWVCFSTRRTC